MDYDHEIRSLGAESIATQMILGQILFRIGKADPKIAGAIVEGLDDAANIVEELTIRLGPSAHPDHLVKTLKIVEEIRAAVLGRYNKPDSM